MNLLVDGLRPETEALRVTISDEGLDGVPFDVTSTVGDGTSSSNDDDDTVDSGSLIIRGLNGRVVEELP